MKSRDKVNMDHFVNSIMVKQLGGIFKDERFPNLFLSTCVSGIKLIALQIRSHFILNTDPRNNYNYPHHHDEKTKAGKSHVL